MNLEIALKTALEAAGIMLTDDQINPLIVFVSVGALALFLFLLNLLYSTIKKNQ